MTLIRKHLFTLIGVLLGSVAGFAYWKFVGCTSVTCPITSSPVNSTLYGAIMGGLFLNMIKDYTTRK